MSDRPAAIIDFDRAVGMYINVVPRVVESGKVSDLFAEIQAENLRSLPHQYMSLDEITGGEDQADLAQPFNNLLAVQSYRWDTVASDELVIEALHSDLTSNYPVTCIVDLYGDWNVVLRNRHGSLSPAAAEWFIDGFLQLLQQFRELETDDIFDPFVALDKLPPPPVESILRTTDKETRFVLPRNGTELTLAEIWADLLPADRIGVDDDFFELGGTSFLALKLFARIERRFGKRLSPSLLLSRRTIRQIALLLSGASENRDWNNLVPLRIRGKLSPVFCFHAGEGNVLLYQSLVKHLNPERPVYALQPNGIDGEAELDGTIEKMAAHYLAEIDRLDVDGPLILLAYCYSGAICVEIGRQLLNAGRPAPVIICTDADPPNIQRIPEIRGFRMPGSPIWYWGHLRLGRWATVREQIAADFLPKKWLSEDLRVRLKTLRLRQNLLRAFFDYEWPQDYGFPILFIQSSELRTWKKYQHIIQEWEKLAGGALTVRDVEAQHATLYHEPAVADMARHIEQYLQESTGINTSLQAQESNGTGRFTRQSAG